MRPRAIETAPRPTVPPVLTHAEVWRRLPLTRTSVWSRKRPRNVTERIWVLPSGVVGCGLLKDGVCDWMIFAVSA